MEKLKLVEYDLYLGQVLVGHLMVDDGGVDITTPEHRKENLWFNYIDACEGNHPEEVYLNEMLDAGWDYMIEAQKISID